MSNTSGDPPTQKTQPKEGEPIDIRVPTAMRSTPR